ncbi:MAG: cell division protein FtsQ/DivIB [Ferrimicrobium sp.]
MDDRIRRRRAKTIRASRRGRRAVIVSAVVVALSLGTAGVAYAGPWFRAERIVVTGVSPSVTATLQSAFAPLVGTHLWHLDRASVEGELDRNSVLGAEISLTRVVKHLPDTVVITARALPLAGSTLPSVAIAPNGLVVHGVATSLVRICPTLLSALSATCPKAPLVGSTVSPTLVAAADALSSARFGAEVEEVAGVGVVAVLTNSIGCELGTASQTSLKVHICVALGSPGGIVDVRSPSDPAILVGERVG